MPAADTVASTTLSEALRLGPNWEPVLREFEVDPADPLAWRRRFIVETEPIDAPSLRVVALRMRGLGPSAIAHRTGRAKPMGRRRLDGLCLAAALRYTSDDAGPGLRLTSARTAGGRLVNDGPPAKGIGTTQQAFDRLWLQGLDLTTVRTTLKISDRAARSLAGNAPRRWFGKDIAEQFGWSRENHRLRLARGHFPAPDGRDRNSDWWWPETVQRWAETQPFTACPHCGARVLRLKQHLTGHRTGPSV